MADQEQFRLLKLGLDAWNEWRQKHHDITPNLSHADLRGISLNQVDLHGAHLRHAVLNDVLLTGANFCGANLTGATLNYAQLDGADFRKAILRFADLNDAFLSDACFADADLRAAHLRHANLRAANLNNVNLQGADLSGADLGNASLIRANLTQTDLRHAQLVSADLSNGILTGSLVFGVAVWGATLDGAEQRNLVISNYDEPTITADNLELAQFIHTIFDNRKIRDFISTTTSKAVLILGRFSKERKAVLEAIREELRRRGYLPVLFDFAGSETIDTTETITLLARMSRFIVADLTEPKSVPKELEAIVPTLAVPVQPLIKDGTPPYSMFSDYWKYHWVLKVHSYDDVDNLITNFKEMVIDPAERKKAELAAKRRDALL